MSVNTLDNLFVLLGQQNPILFKAEKMSSLDKLLLFLQKDAEQGTPPRPGLVPQSGNPRAPYRWVRPEEKNISETPSSQKLQYGGIQVKNPKFKKFMQEVRDDFDANKDEMLKYAQKLIPEADIQDIKLHGSYAKGTPREDSDIDILVEYSGDVEPKVVMDSLREKFHGVGGVYDVGAIKISKEPWQMTWKDKYGEVRSLSSVEGKLNNLAERSVDNQRAIWTVRGDKNWSPSQEAIDRVTPLVNEVDRLSHIEDEVLAPLRLAREPWQLTKDQADAAISYGRMGKVVRKGDIRFFYRVGAPPEGGHSFNTMTRAYEKGVSVYVTPMAGSFAGDVKRPWYYGKGEVIGFGGDDEPLIKVIGRWKKYPGHRQVIQQALTEGKPVPPAVLAEYPDLGRNKKTQLKKQDAGGFFGTVAVSTDPGIYTITYGEDGKKKTNLEDLQDWIEEKSYPEVDLEKLLPILSSEQFLTKAEVISTPKDAEGKFAPDKVPVGKTVWITISDPESPLHGRHIQLTKRPDGLLAVTGGAGMSEAVESRRHMVFGGTPRKTSRDKELEQRAEAAERYNEPLMLAERELRQEARQELTTATSNMMQALGVSKIDKQYYLDRKDEVQNHIEKVLGEDSQAESKRITDLIMKRAIEAEREIKIRTQQQRQQSVLLIGKKLQKLRDAGEEISTQVIEDILLEDTLGKMSVPLPNISALSNLTPRQQETEIDRHFNEQTDNFFAEDRLQIEEKKDVPSIELGKTLTPLEIKDLGQIESAVNHVQDYWQKRKDMEMMHSQIKRVPKADVASSTLASLKDSIERSRVEITPEEIETKIDRDSEQLIRNKRTLAFYDALGDFWNDDTSLMEELGKKSRTDQTLKFHVDSGAGSAIAALAKEYLGSTLDTRRIVESANVEVASAFLAQQVYEKFRASKDAKGYDEVVAKIRTFNAQNQTETEKRALNQHATLTQQWNEIRAQKENLELVDKMRIAELEANNLLDQRKNIGAAFGSLQASAMVLDNLEKLRRDGNAVIRIRTGTDLEDAQNLVQRLRLSKRNYLIDQSDSEDLAVNVLTSSLRRLSTEEKDLQAKQDKYEKLKTDMSGVAEDDEGRLTVEKFDVPNWKKTFKDSEGNEHDYKWRVEQRNDINWLLETTTKNDENPLGKGGGLITRVTGAGKTNTALGFFGFQMKENPDYKGLVIVPKGRTQQWKEEADKFSDLRTEIIPEGLAKDKVDEILAKSKPGTIYIVAHREAAKSHNTFAAMQIDEKLGMKFHGFVVDEPQELQARGQSGNIGEMGKRIFRIPVGHRIALTATPARRNPVEAYDLIRWSSGTRDLGSKESFRRIFSGFGGGTNAQDTAIRNMYYQTIKPYISGDRITEPNFKVKHDTIQVSRTYAQRAEQRDIEARSGNYIQKRRQEIMQQATENPSHPLHRGANWQSKLSQSSLKWARKEVEDQHITNLDGGDYRENAKLSALKQELEKGKDQKHVIFIDSRVQRNALDSIYQDVGLKPNQVKNLAATTGSITGEEMSRRAKAFRDDPNIRIIVIDRASSSGYNLQQGDSIHFLGTPSDGATYLQAQGRVARSPRKGDVRVVDYRYQDNPVENSKFNDLDSQLKVLRASSPGLFVGQE